jgi:tRNA (cmo5U34)-methyltransferase
VSDGAWSEDNSRSFIEYVPFFVPEREDQVDAICSLLPAPVGTQMVVELACGDGSLAEALLARYPESTVWGLDISPTMLAAATERLASYGSRFHADRFELSASDWRDRWRDCWAVVTSLTVHHLDGGGKRRLFADVAGMLAPGGVFVLADLVAPASASARELAASQWDAAVRRRSLEGRGDLSAFEAFERLRWNAFRPGNDDPDFDKPSQVIEQLDWLREAGLQGVDVVWAKAGHAVLCGYRPL